MNGSEGKINVQKFSGHHMGETNHGCTGRLSRQHYYVDRGATQCQWGKEAARVD